MRTLLISILLLALINSTIGQTASATYQEVSEKKVTGKIGNYIAKDGQTYSIGDTLYLGTPSADKNYDFIRSKLGTAMFNNVGTVAVITKLKIYKRVVYVYSPYPHPAVNEITISLEQAIQTGEINSGEMSSNQALEALKKAKDKLDLDLITQEEYEAIKAELAPLIK